MSESEAEKIKRLEKEIEELTSALAESKKKGFFEISDWKDGVKLLALPLAFFLGIYNAYDNVWLRWKGQDAATVANVIEGLEKLQGLDEKTFTRQASGDQSAAAAVDAAQRGNRERLTARAFDYWLNSPEFFQRSELDTLAHHLILQRRTQDAIAVIESLLPEARGAFDKADLLLKIGRAHGAEGDAHDLNAARTALTKSAEAAEDITARGTRNSAITNITFYRVHMELYNEQSCHHISPYIQNLQKLSVTDAATRSPLDDQIAQLTAIYDNRC